MQKVIHRAEDRGETKERWLLSKHSFSFGSYFDVERVGFGALRTLNDDWVQAGEGFPEHAHKNMEIVTIVLDGALRHSDSTGATGVLHAGEAQVMSAGSGITHSEMNNSETHPVEFLQIWIVPKKLDVEPRHAQMVIDPGVRNEFIPIALATPSERALTLNQNAYIYLGTLEEGTSLGYRRHEYGSGIYVFVIEGEVEILEESLKERDAIGIWELDAVEFSTKTQSTILICEVPMAI